MEGGRENRYCCCCSVFHQQTQTGNGMNLHRHTRPRPPPAVLHHWPIRGIRRRGKSDNKEKEDMNRGRRGRAKIRRRSRGRSFLRSFVQFWRVLCFPPSGSNRKLLLVQFSVVSVRRLPGLSPPQPVILGWWAWLRLAGEDVCARSEEEVFRTQRGEALLQALRGHILQPGRLPARTVVLVYQHWRAETSNS